MLVSALCMAPVVACIGLSLPVPGRDAHAHRLYPFLHDCPWWQAATVWYLCAVVVILPMALFGNQPRRLARQPGLPWVSAGMVGLALVVADLAWQFVPSLYVHRDWLLEYPALLLPLASISPALFAAAIRGLKRDWAIFVVVAVALPAILVDFRVDWRTISPMADALPLIARLALLACLARLTGEEVIGLQRYSAARACPAPAHNKASAPDLSSG